MKKVNVTLNLGLVTKNFMPVNKKTAMKIKEWQDMYDNNNYPDYDA